MKKVKTAAITLASLTLLGIVIPASSTVVQASEISQINSNEKLVLDINAINTSTKSLSLNNQNLVSSYTNELSKEFIDVLNEGTPNQQANNMLKNEKGVGSLMAHLLLHYTKTYILKTLPKLLYKKVAGVIGGVVSEASFVKVWGNIIGIATLSNIGSLVSNGLNSLGVTGWLSDAIGNAIQIAIDVFL